MANVGLRSLNGERCDHGERDRDHGERWTAIAAITASAIAIAIVAIMANAIAIAIAAFFHAPGNSLGGIVANARSAAKGNLLSHTNVDLKK